MSIMVCNTGPEQSGNTKAASKICFVGKLFQKILRCIGSIFDPIFRTVKMLRILNDMMTQKYKYIVVRSV